MDRPASDGRSALSLGMPRRLDHVQGLRGLAMLTIVVYHCDLPPSGGFVALDVFFVISGYVIAGLLLRERLSTGRVRFGQFYLRRVRRLLPALALMLTTVAILSALLESPLSGQKLTSRIGMYASASLANIGLERTRAGYFDAPSEAFTLRHTWSLSVEEQFYLLFPLLLVLALGARRRLRVLTWVLLVVGAVSLAALAMIAFGPGLPYVHRSHSAAYYLPVTRAWEFIAGVLVGIWHTSRPALSRRSAAWAAGAGTALVVGATVLFTAEIESSNPILLIPVGGAALVLVGCRTPGLLSRVLSWRPFTWAGDRSYGWYLWHWPLIVFARDLWPDNRLALVAAAALGLVISMITYRAVEQRFRYPSKDATPRQQTRSGLRLALACFLVPLVMLGLLGVAARRDWGSAKVRAMAAQLLPNPPGGGRLGCPIDEALRTGSIAACTRGTGAAPIYLLGDSNAGMHAAGLIAVGAAAHRPVVLLWRPGCPYVEQLTVRRPGYDVAGCDHYNAQVGRWLATHPGGTTVVSDGSEYLLASAATFEDRVAGVSADEQGTKAELWQTALTRTLTTLGAHGHDVVVLGLIAHPDGVDSLGRPEWEPLRCALVVMIVSVDGCGITATLHDEDARQRLQLEAERAAARAARATYVDLRAAICAGGTCRTVRDGRWIYRNGLHVTSRESLTLVPQLARGVLAGDAS